MSGFSSAPRSERFWTRQRLLLVGGLLVLLGAAFWLRWRYIQDISLFVDEFTTIWAATRVQALGVPLMPSGVLYTRGLLSSYVEAAFLALFGMSYTVARLPSLLFGLASAVIVFAMGRREWNAPVGWLAAIGLVLLPEAIVWSGRARFYAQWQVFFLLAAWAGFASVVVEPNDVQTTSRRQWTFALLFVLALYSQEATILLYPAFLLATILWRGWRFLLRRSVLSANLVCILAIVVRYVIEKIGQPGYFETIQAQRPYVGLVFDVAGAWWTYSPLLTAPLRLPFTFLGLISVAVALVALLRQGWRPARLPRFHQATLYFGLLFWFLFILIMTVVGTSWRDTRYLFVVQPLWLLLGSAGAAWLLERIPSRPLRWAATALAMLTLIAVWWTPARAVLGQQVEGYDLALERLSQARQPGDVIMTPQPPACALVLGPCDYYAVQRGYEEYVIRRDGVLVDRWSGARLLDSTAQLQEIIRTLPRVWLIVDGFRLATRYDADFVRTVVEQFDVASDERGVMLLQADGWRDLPAPVAVQEFDLPAPFPPLALTGWERTAAEPGEELRSTLFWTATEKVSQQINTSVQLVAADGSRLTQSDGPPARGMIPTTLVFDTPVPDPKTLALPADLAAGRYRLEATAYDVATLTPLAEPVVLDWFTVGPPPQAPAIPIGAQWEGGLQLTGHDAITPTVRPGETVDVRLVWQTFSPLAHDYTVFVHLVAPDGSTLAQDDHAPQHGFYPTSAWKAGEAVEDFYTLVLPADAPAGEYDVVVGLYRPETGERLSLAGGGEAAGDAFTVAMIKVGDEP